jgi:hypothetical protein
LCIQGLGSAKVLLAATICDTFFAVTTLTVESSWRFLAGFTLQQVYTEPKLSPEHTWCKADYRQFNVRVGPDYPRYKKKAPSAAPIYEPFAVDVFWYVFTAVTLLLAAAALRLFPSLQVLQHVRIPQRHRGNSDQPTERAN